MEKKAGTGFVPGRSSQLGKSKKYQCNAISTLKIKMLYKAKNDKRILDFFLNSLPKSTPASSSGLSLGFKTNLLPELAKNPTGEKH